MEWTKCSEITPPVDKLLMLFVDGDYEFGQYREDAEFWIYTDGRFIRRYVFSEVTHFLILSQPSE